MPYSNKKVLISGGLGFLGSNLALKLAEQGADVTIVDSMISEYGANRFNIDGAKGSIKINISDIRDPYSINALVKGADYLFNLAGQTSRIDSMNDPFADLDINSRAQLSILEACRHHNPDIKIIYAGSKQVYGKPEYLPVDEKHRIAPDDVNGINKASAEMYHILYYKAYGIRSTILRLSSCYGPRMRIKDSRQTFIGVWFRNILSSKPIIIVGDGKHIRDLNYSDDVVEALLLAGLSEATNGEIYNLGSSIPMSLIDYAQILIDIYGKGARYELKPINEATKKLDIGNYYGNFNKIKKALGWEPKIDFENGAERTLNYFAQNLEKYCSLEHF
jgi:nucleoside-diphosphate-sugar epimerase